MRVLVVNAGSSSLKLRVLDPHDRVVGSSDLPPPTEGSIQSGVAEAIRGFGPVDAVGHRIVHGGTTFTGPVRIDEDVESRLRALADLAPLHQPKSLAALDAVGEVLPGVPAVACFDTAFHSSLPPAAATYAVPHEWRDRLGVRRYGFHGLSHAYASRRAAEVLARPVPELRVVTCHLGAGASLAAVEGGRSVDTTMGFTPLEGLVMATRSGTIDPGMVLWLQRHAGLQPEELEDALEHHSGLQGLAGTADMREVLASAASGDATARLALDVYVHRVRAAVASMAAAMGGVDAVVFTAGVGQNAPEVRRLVADGLGFLGVQVDPSANAASFATDRDISAPDARVRTLVVAAREDLQIVREARSVL
jgi:acetate kinase